MVILPYKGIWVIFQESHIVIIIFIRYLVYGIKFGELNVIIWRDGMWTSHFLVGFDFNFNCKLLNGIKERKKGGKYHLPYNTPHPN